MMAAQKSETPLAGGATQETNQRTDARIIGDAEAERKQFATLQAGYARLGHELHRLPDGSYYTQRWGLTRDLSGLHEVGEFLRQIGGAA
jgi:hypothetical protein